VLSWVGGRVSVLFEVYYWGGEFEGVACGFEREVV